MFPGSRHACFKTANGFGLHARRNSTTPATADFSPNTSVERNMADLGREIAGAFLLVYAGLFPVVNPLGAAPVFLSLTSNATAAQRNRLALSVAVNSFLLLLGSMLFGSHVLEFFGITIPAVRVAGGALVAFMGWKLLSGGGEASIDPSPKLGPSQGAMDGFYPLTLPLTVGPGSISVALTIGAHHAGRPFTTHLALIASSALLGLVALALTIYAAYRFAFPLVRVLGETGVNALVRLSAFVLVCIGVQIAWGGLSELIAGLHAT
jgi:multiple antibiotic resistance protein